MTLLKRLRKYRRTLTGAMLPVLAFVWVGVAASPCAAMDAASGSMPTMDHGDTPMMGHDDTPPMDHGGERASTHSRPPCPHCPPTQDHTVPHAACVTLSAFLSSDALAAPAYDLSHALPIVGLLPLQDDPPRDEKRRRSERPQDASSHVPLNLRYCVFLN